MKSRDRKLTNSYLWKRVTGFAPMLSNLLTRNAQGLIAKRKCSPMVDPVSTSNGASVMGALQNASQKTGVGFDFLYRMAQRESALDPAAKAATSSAAGLFQFIEQTWFNSVKTHGAKHGLGDYAADIVRNASGKLTVTNEARRQEILDLRFDASKASALAAELANDNKSGLEKRLGRQVGGAELYAAHFLGVGGAAKLLSASPGANAAALLPAAAKANRPVFYNEGSPRTVAEVMASFEKSMGVAMRKAMETVKEIKSGFASSLSFPDLQAPQRGMTTSAAVAPTLETAAAKFSASDPLRSTVSHLSEGLSPLALVVLQALDPTSLRTNDSDR